MKLKTKTTSDIINEALNDIEAMKGVLNANTRDILKNIAKDDIDSAIREGIEDFEEDDVDVDSIGDEVSDTDVDMGDATGEDDSLDSIDAGMESGLDSEVDVDGLSIDSDVDDIDLTGADDEALVSVYKELSPMDEIEIVGDEIHLTVTEPGKYVIKTNDVGGVGPAVGSDELGSELGDDELEIDLGDTEGGEEEIDIDSMTDDSEGGEETETDVEDSDDETSDDDSEGESDEDELAESIMYEVYIEDEDEETVDESEEVTEGEKIVGEEEAPIEEAIPVGMAQAKRVPGKNTPIKGAGARDMKETKTVAQYEKLLKEATSLKAENETFKKALVEFKKEFAKTVVFNNNLSYAVKLFLEHPTTNAEKKSILSRFDNEVKSINEGKSLYKKIATELLAKTPIIESIDSNDKSMTSSVSNNKNLNVKNLYMDEKTLRLMERVEGRKLM